MTSGARQSFQAIYYSSLLLPQTVADISTAMTSALVFGGGCIGAITAHLLSSQTSQANIAIVCRSNFNEVSKEGITIRSEYWGTTTNSRPSVFSSVKEAAAKGKEYDYIFITTKVASKGAVETSVIRPAITSRSAIVLMQNGIAIEEPWRKAYPHNTIISAVLYLPVRQISPTTFGNALSDIIQLGTFPAEAPKHHKEMAETLKDILHRGGATVSHEQDIQFSRWKKLLVNGSENPICALTRLPDATYFQSSPEAIPFMQQVMNEIAAIARATGQAGIDDKVVQEQMKLLTSRPLPGVVPSMMADILSEREMEVDAILGNVLEIGEKLKVKTPLLNVLYTLTKGLNFKYKSI